MAQENLQRLRVAILVENGFEQVELIEPSKALDRASAETSIVSPQRGSVRGWNFTLPNGPFPAYMSRTLP